MAAYDLDGFREFFAPQYDEVEDGTLRRQFRTSMAFYGGDDELMRYYLVAHLVTVSQRVYETGGRDASELGGEVIRVVTDDQTVEYLPQSVAGTGKTGSRDAFFNRTEPGKLFREMEQRALSYVFSAGVTKTQAASD